MPANQSKASGLDLPTDPVSLEAMIANHKAVRAFLEVRMIAEEGVRSYHKKSMKTMDDYAAVNKKLDKYRKCFDLIDLILNTTATGFHAYNSFAACKKNVSAYYKLLNAYEKEMLFTGAIWTSDTIIINASQRAVRGAYNGVSQLWKSYIELSELISGVRNCTTSDLMIILNDINFAIDEIEVSIRRSYMELWAYMTVRMGFWKRPFFMAKTVKEVAYDALKRWLKSSSKEKLFSTKDDYISVEHKPLGGGGIIGGRRY